MPKQLSQAVALGEGRATDPFTAMRAVAASVGATVVDTVQLDESEIMAQINEVRARGIDDRKICRARGEGGVLCAWSELTIIVLGHYMYWSWCVFCAKHDAHVVKNTRML